MPPYPDQTAQLALKPTRRPDVEIGFAFGELTGEEFARVAQLLEHDPEPMESAIGEVLEATPALEDPLVSLVEKTPGEARKWLVEYGGGNHFLPGRCLGPATEAKQERGEFRITQCLRPFVGALALRVGCCGEAHEGLVIRPRCPDRRQRFGDEYVPVARRTQQVDGELCLAFQPHKINGRENGPESGENGAQPTQCNTKLMHSCWIGTDQHCIQIRRAVAGASEKDCPQGAVHRDTWFQCQRGSLVTGVCFCSGEDVPALGLAGRLNAERRGALQSHGEFVERACWTLDQLELKLRDRIPLPLGSDLSVVERDLDQGNPAIGCRDLDFGGAAHDIGAEHRSQLRRSECTVSGIGPPYFQRI